MEFLKPAMVFTALACGVLAASFLYVWLAYTRSRYALFWALSWLVAVPHLACAWVLIDSPDLRAVQIADQMLLVANAILMVCGCYDFVFRRVPVRAIALAALPFVAWGVLAPQTSAAFMKTQLPNALLLGGSYLWTAGIFWHLHRTRQTRGALVIAILFALGGLHEFDFPLLGNVPWAAPVGYAVASVLAMAIALSLLILILEELRIRVEQERARLQGVLDALPVGVLMYDPAGAVALDNRAARALLGGTTATGQWTMPALAARLLAPIEGAAQKPVGDSPMMRSLRTGEVCAPQEFALLDTAGARRSVLVNAGPVYDAKSRLLGVVTVVQDVEDLKHVERQMLRTERLQALGTLAAGMAHNFNNNLTLILGHAQLALQVGSDVAVHKRLDAICRIAADSVGIVSRIQDLARARPADMQAETALDLGALVHDVVELARPRWRDGAEAAGIRYVVETRLQSDVAISGQAADLKEAVLNLVINALDAMPAGGSLRLTVAADGAEAVLIVTDDGEGMPPEVRERIFDPFFSTKGARGTGLGLSLVFGVVERHRGQIGVASDPGKGTTFTLRFPLSAASAAIAIAEDAMALPASRHVLVVDDEPPLRALTVEMLEAMGYRATAAETGEAAKRMLEDPQFDLVFTDLAMPDVTGWDIAAHAAKVRPGLPVVLVTGWGQTISAEELESKGAAGVLAKPYTLEELAAVVEHAAPAEARAA